MEKEILEAQIEILEWALDMVNGCPIGDPDEDTVIAIEEKIEELRKQLGS